MRQIIMMSLLNHHLRWDLWLSLSAVSGCIINTFTELDFCNFFLLSCSTSDGLDWAWSFSLYLQVMRAPRDIFQLADTVNTDSDRRDQLTEQTMTDSVWIRSFLQIPKMRDSRERTELFYFLVYTSILATVEKTDKERTRDVLEYIRARYFTDSQFYQANIAVADIHNVVNDIFRWANEG